LLSNEGIDVWDCFARWVPYQIGERRDLLVAMDWTDFAHDDQATLVLSLVTGHGRAAPLAWLSVWKDELTEQRNDSRMPACAASPNWSPREAGERDKSLPEEEEPWIVTVEPCFAGSAPPCSRQRSPAAPP
jgi:hypothetical protein